MKVRLDGPLGSIEKLGDLAGREALLVHQHERGALVAGQLVQCPADTASQGHITGRCRRRVGCVVVGDAAPEVPNRPPAPVVMRLSDEDPVEPGPEARVSAEPTEGAIGLDERLLGDVLGGGLIAPDQSPGHPARPLDVLRDERAEAALEICIQSGCVQRHLCHRVLAVSRRFFRHVGSALG